MAERGQPVHRRRERLDAVDRDAGVARVPVVGEHVAQAFSAQLAQRDRGRRIGNDQHDTVDAGRAQRIDGAALVGEPVLGGHRHDRVAGRRCGLGDALQAFGEDRIKERRQHDA